MKKLLLTLLGCIVLLTIAQAQRGIDYKRNYAAGGKMLMSVDSAAKNVFYANAFPNQPHISFNFLPEVHNVSIRIFFRKHIKAENYRYTILADDQPIVLNKPIETSQLKDAHAGDEEIFNAVSFGIFPIKNKVLTILTYDIEKPADVYKTIFYGRPLPKAKIQFLSKRFKTEQGFDYDNILNLKDTTEITFREQDDELTIIKEASDIDYLYSISIKDKQRNEIVFKSDIWKFGGYTDELYRASPYVNIDKSVFKKSGDYEIIIEPSLKWEGCLDCDLSAKDVEKYITRHTLSITLDEQNYTKKELIIYTLLVALGLGTIFLIISFITRKRNKKKLADEQRQKDIAKLQLNSVRSQLNPHFLFNALSGIQNLMNKNETDKANKYLSKFARLTRNVLANNDLISLKQEKTLLDDYLQMEQLRFGFAYQIDLSEEIDADNTEIPSMLLQPFVENAVKHGISHKVENGTILVAFNKQANDLILSVADNGKGFDPIKKSDGLGLQLSESRIALLNSIYKENRFTLEIGSTTTGTRVTLTITDWLI
ncbi:sensor histidine kinase [Pedobacter deserti]|uniref:sensor histidine kinase n=1 Tax=Pedobacter deserti TaxID=2817382 RepID=UPI00210E657B|nr:histidine kinase [Pedobacter sp. SYSU D00382]